jgi:hypothetical protein
MSAISYVARGSDGRAPGSILETGISGPIPLSTGIYGPVSTGVLVDRSGITGTVHEYR